MPILDRILTIVVTATLTSAAWIVMGGSLIENARGDGQLATTRPAEAVPSPTGQSGSAEGNGANAPGAAALDAPARDSVVDGEPMIPVLNVRRDDLTDTFSDERGDGARLHEALDIMAPKGTSVVAAAPGKVEKLFRSDAGGKTIYVRSDDRDTIYYYAHLDEYAEGLREGQKVRRGQRLGTVGSTGNASDEVPHLHFAILQTTPDAQWWEPATAVNPYPIFTER